MRNLLAAVLVMAIASSAMAAVIEYTPFDVAGGEKGSVGIVDPANPDALNSVYVDDAILSDTFVFTFALHVDSTYWAERLDFVFMYDNSSIEILHAEPIGAWSNYYSDYPEDGEWPNPTNGVIQVDMQNEMSPTAGSTTYWYSSINPFMKVTFHIKSDTFSQENPFGITEMTLRSDYSTIWSWDFDYLGGIVHEVPEPTSLMFLGFGLAAIGGRVIRRRR